MVMIVVRGTLGAPDPWCQWRSLLPFRCHLAECLRVFVRFSGPSQRHAETRENTRNIRRNRVVAPTGSDRAWGFVIEEFVPLVA
jgi:hypothetical protein